MSEPDPDFDVDEFLEELRDHTTMYGAHPAQEELDEFGALVAGGASFDGQVGVLTAAVMRLLEVRVVFLYAPELARAITFAAAAHVLDMDDWPAPRLTHLFQAVQDRMQRASDQNLLGEG